MKISFSVSDIVTAFKCPIHFCLRKHGIKAYFYYGSDSGIGTFVHSVLSEFAHQMGKNTLFGKETDISKTMNESFRKVFLSTKADIDFEEAYEYIKSAAAYFGFKTEGKTKSEIREMFVYSEKPFSVHLEGIKINGKFDILLKTGSTFEIIDYKTRRSEIDLDGIQIALYKYAVKNVFNADALPVILTIEKGAVSKETLDEEEYEKIIGAVRAKVREMKEIFSGEKLPKFAPDKEICKHCSVRYNCKRLFKEVCNGK